jgi:hypothetical protein
MHIRHFLLPTLMLGAALFLPENALAEKSEQNGPPSHSNKAIVQTVKNPAAPAAVAESAKPVEKTVPAPQQQAKAVKQVPSHAAPKAATPQAATEATKTLPAQANGNGYGLSDTKETEKPVTAPGLEKKGAVQNKDSAVGPEQPVNKPEPEVKNKVKPTKAQPQQKATDSSASVNIEPPAPTPAEKDTAPSSKEKLPPVDQAPNPTQRSNNTGGSGKDRVSAGFGTTSLVDKWIDWDKYVEMKLVQPFLTREALMNTQWVNAPPSPPPQSSSFFKNR